MPTLVQIDAWDPVTAAVVSLLSSSHDDPSVCHLGGYTWWPTIAKLPALRYDLFDGSFGSQITAPSSTISLQTEPWPYFGRYILADARFRLWHGSLGDPASAYVLRFDGRVSTQPKLQDGRAEIDFAVDDRWLDTSLLTLYAGTTGVEGPATLKGQAKPLALGAPRYVSGKLIDSANSVFQVSAYGAVNGFEAALEKLARFPAAIGDYPTYAALVAATIPAGQWATAKAVGMARFGAPPTGQISFLLQGDAAGTDGWARTPGKVIRRLAILSGGTGKVDDASLNALDAARPYNVSIYIDAQTTAREVIQKLAASVNAVAGVSWTGQLFVAPVAVGTATTILAADGSALPAVSSVQQIDIASPYQKLAIDAERAWTVHELADIAFTATVVDLGLYAAATSYREGNVVNLSDGSRWLFVAATPATGSAPTTSNANWSRLTGPTAAVYGDGTSIEVLKPAQAGADKTAANTAAGIAGQGAFATINTAGYGSQYLTGFGALAPLASISFGGNYLFRADGTTRITDALAITALGTAAAIAGQSLFATYNATTPGALLAPSANLIFDSTFRFGAQNWTASSVILTSIGAPDSVAFAYTSADGTNSRASPRFAVGVTTYCLQAEMVYGANSGNMCVDVVWFDGSGNTSTSARLVIANSGITSGTDISGRASNYTSLYIPVTPPAGTVQAAVRIYTENKSGGSVYWRRLKLALGSLPTPWEDGATMSARYSTDQVLMDALRPGEFGANVTENRSAAAIAGQGAFATISTAAYGSSLLTGFGALAPLASILLGSTYIYQSNGTTKVTDASAITSLGTASAIAGQGAFATVNTAAYGSNLLTGFGALAPLASLALGGSYLFQSNGTTQLTDGTVVTSNGTAAAIAGQGAFATVSSAAYGSSLLTGFGALAPLASLALGGSYLYQSNGTTKLTDGSVVTANGTAAAIAGQGALATRSSVTLNTTTIYRADGTTIVSETIVITSQGTAAAIAGQGKGATANSLNDLDSAAAKQLANAAAAQTTIKIGVGTSSIISRSVPAGGSIGLNGSVKFNTYSSSSGTAKLSLQVAPGGSASFGEVASGTTNVGPDGPGVASANGTFTNNTSATMVYDVRAVVTGVGSATTDATGSFLTA